MAISQEVLDGIRDGSITNLSLHNKKLTTDDAFTLAEALKDNCTLTSLDVGSNQLGNEGVCAIIEALEGNKTLVELSLALTGKAGEDPASKYSRRLDLNTSRTIGEFIKNSASIQTLNLGFNQLGNMGIATICDGLKSNDTIKKLNLNNSNPYRGSQGLETSYIVQMLEANQSITRIDLSSNGLSDEALSAFFDFLKSDQRLTTFNIEDERDPSPQESNALADAIISSGSKNIMRAWPQNAKLEKYCDNNQAVVKKLIDKINNNLESLTVTDYGEIKDRILGIDHMLFAYSTGDEERYSLFSKLKDAAAEHGVEIAIPLYLDAVMNKKRESEEKEKQATEEEIKAESQSQFNKSRERIATIAARHSVSTSDMLGREFDSALSLEEIEQLISEGKESLPEGSNVQQARIALANHEIIPHLDYFVISALSAIENPESIDFSDYPNIERAAGTNYNLSTFKQQARSKQSAEGGLNFDYLHDESQGDHMTRLRRALGEVNGTIGQYEDMFKAIDAEVAEIQLKIGQQRGLIDERGAYLKDVRKANEFRTDRMFEYQARLNASLDTANLRSAAAGSKTLGQGAAMIAEVIFDGVPLLSGISKKISEMVGVPNPIKAAGEAAMTQAIARTETKASREIMAYYSKKQIDEGAIEREIRTVKEGMKKLEANTEFKRLEQDKTKQKAVAEAFVNKLMLNFGQHMSENLLAVCEEHGIGKIDDFFDAFKGDPRLHEAFTNLCFGYADSNDLSVIFAEVAGMKGDEPTHAAAREYVEAVLKPNIDDLYAHASKVDLIYQANLTGLGTDLHHARHMIRDEHDVRARALFGDSFGVDSQMGALTIRGAVDVKNLFDYYMHRHGKNTLTDTKIHDGLVTDNRAPKRLSLLDDDVMAEHKELAKASRGYRQDGPDVSDMFLRICGYEYFVPQAPNDAQRGNIMANNPEAPASYQMANRVVKEFIQKLSFTHIDDYRAKVGTTDKAPSKLDNLMAQTFMDFFSEVGAIHAADPKLGAKRADLKSAAKETGTFGFAFDSYERLITKDALGHFDLFLEIYKRNLEVQLRDASKEDGKLLRDQIAAVAELTQQQLSPKVIEPGSDDDRHRARLASHTYGNTHWRGAC